MTEITPAHALTFLLTPLGTALAGVVVSAVAGLAHEMLAWSHIRPDVPKSVRLSASRFGAPAAIFTPEGKRHRTQRRLYTLLAVLFGVAAFFAIKAEGHDTPAWLLAGSGFALLLTLVRRDLRAWREGREEAATVYVRGRAAPGAAAPIPERFGPDDRERCPCCLFPTLTIVGEAGEVIQECPLCDYDGPPDAADLAPRRERFRATLTSFTPEELAEWGCLPPTPQECVLKRTIVERFEEMERGGYGDRSGWAEIRQLEKQLDALGLGESVAHELLIPPDEPDGEPDEDEDDPDAEDPSEDEDEETEAEAGEPTEDVGDEGRPTHQ